MVGGSILEIKKRLFEALLRVSTLHDRELRDLYLSELENQLGHSLGVSRHTDTRPDVRYLLNACLDHDGALRAFVAIVREIHGDTTQIREVQQLVDEFERTSLKSERRFVDSRRQNPESSRSGSASDAHLLRGSVPVERLTRVLGELGMQLWAAYEQVLGQVPDDLRDVSAFIAQLESLGSTADRDLTLLQVIDRLAHDVGGQMGLELHALVDQTGMLLGLDQATIRGICTSASAHLAQPAGVSRHAEATEKQNLSDISDIIHHREDPVAQTSALNRMLTETERSGRIWGGMPIRNPDFTGRERLIDDLRLALTHRSKASVLPETLHGLGGVGKTQLAIEYVYRHVDQYDLVWWISAEDPASVGRNLAQLGERLGLPPSDDMQKTARAVLDVLSVTSPYRWLLVYDNADKPDDITPLLPGGSGGHVIVTSRNQEWARAGDSIEVDVFHRAESIALLQRRGEGISHADADLLAEKLGDLPLALEQAATWQAATRMPISEYLQLFEEHARELLSEGKPTYYPTTVYAFLRMAVEKLREDVPAVSELLELFAFLGSEPLSTTLLRSGRTGGLSDHLRDTLAEPIKMNRAIRELRRHGLARVDPSGQTIQVHRLVQLVLREELREDRRERSRHNVQNLLATANPGVPLHPSSWSLYKEIGLHIIAADLINADDRRCRAVVLDQARYLHRIGDYEGSRQLAESAVGAWSTPVDDGGLGPNDGQTLTAKRRLANALRQIGDYREARLLAEDVLRGLRENPEFGEDHEDTLATANSVALDLRLAGAFQEAFDLDQDNLARHKRVLGDDDEQTLLMKNNVAVNLRLLGEFQAAYEIDRAVSAQWQQTLGEGDIRTLFSVSNLARDLYGLGRYAEALEIQKRAWPVMHEQLGARHNEVLLAARTIAIAMRKTGLYREALYQARENYLSYHNRFGPDHEHTLAATMSYANTLREIGEWSKARGEANDTVERYTEIFGVRHPFTLAACNNLAIILRGVGDREEARELDERTSATFSDVLGKEHPYTLCVANNLANDLALDTDFVAARDLSERTLILSRRIRGPKHPYTLACAVNAAHDLRHTGDETKAQRLLDETVAALRQVLGPEHPDTVDAARGKRAECDIEPPPT